MGALIPLKKKTILSVSGILLTCIHLAKFLIGHLAFYASFESKIRLCKIHGSINQPRLCRDYVGHFILK